MQSEQITVEQILQELSGKSSITLSARLQEDLGLDSLGLVTLLVEIEDNLGIELQESDMNPFRLKRVADVALLVKKYENS